MTEGGRRESDRRIADGKSYNTNHYYFQKAKYRNMLSTGES